MPTLRHLVARRVMLLSGTTRSIIDRSVTLTDTSILQSNPMSFEETALSIPSSESDPLQSKEETAVLPDASPRETGNRLDHPHRYPKQSNDASTWAGLQCREKALLIALPILLGLLAFLINFGGWMIYIEFYRDRPFVWKYNTSEKGARKDDDICRIFNLSQWSSTVPSVCETKNKCGPGFKFKRREMKAVGSPALCPRTDKFIGDCYDMPCCPYETMPLPHLPFHPYCYKLSSETSEGEIDDMSVECEKAGKNSIPVVIFTKQQFNSIVTLFRDSFWLGTKLVFDHNAYLTKWPNKSLHTLKIKNVRRLEDGYMHWAKSQPHWTTSDGEKYCIFYSFQKNGLSIDSCDKYKKVLCMELIE